VWKKHSKDYCHATTSGTTSFYRDSRNSIAQVNSRPRANDARRSATRAPLTSPPESSRNLLVSRLITPVQVTELLRNARVISATTPHGVGREATLYARIGTWRGTAEALERWAKAASEQVKPKVQKERGLEAAYWLINSEESTGLIITIWESEEAMEAGEQFREQRQARTSEATGASVSTSRYEIIDYISS
jgi:heme-degrading monooxygenase HmoA